MKFKVIVLVPLVAAFGCSSLRIDGPDSNSFSTLTGDTPFHDRHKKISDTQFYVEQLGNGFSNHEKMEKAFIQKAAELCGTKVATLRYAFGRRYPDAILDDNRLESCISGRFCNRTHANFPLVFGTVECQELGRAQ